MPDLPDIIMISANDWGGMWYFRHEFSCRFAALGHRVFYVNRPLQRWPPLRPILDKLILKHPSVGKIAANKPENLTIVEPKLGWGPPHRAFRPVSRSLVRSTISSIRFQDPILITVVPTYSVLEFINVVTPPTVVYFNDQNYDDHPRAHCSVRDSERILAKQAEKLVADSTHNIRRLERLSGRSDILQSPPGVHSLKYSASFRGDEAQTRHKLVYFGGVHEQVDLEMYNRLSTSLKIIFIGVVSPAVRNQISSNIEIRPPASQDSLAAQLREADMLGLFYRPSEYINAVIPAKLFECLATKKPLLVSRLPEVQRYSDVVYTCSSPQETMATIEHLPVTETPAKLARREDLGREADWSNRFAKFYEFVLG